MAVAALVQAGPVRAQAPRDRHGAWVSLAAGPGWSYETCGAQFRTAACAVTGTGRVSVGQLAFGITLRPNVRLGVEVLADQWYARDTAGAVQSNVLAGNLSAVVYFYPLRRADLFLKAGHSLSVLNIDERVGTAAGRRSSFGTGFVGGVGYELPLRRWLSLAAQVSAANGHPGTAQGLTGTRSWEQWLTAATLGVTLHAPKGVRGR